MDRSDRRRRIEVEAAQAQRDHHARTRRVLLDLAARYGALAAAGDEAIAAAQGKGQGMGQGMGEGPPRSEPADAAYYARLETGARWLASRTGSEEEREAHLKMANRYARLRLEAAGGEG